MAKVTAKDSNGDPISLTGIDLSFGMSIINIDKDEEWDLTTIDDTPDTFVDAHVGARPTDR